MDTVLFTITYLVCAIAFVAASIGLGSFVRDAIVLYGNLDLSAKADNAVLTAAVTVTMFVIGLSISYQV